MFTLYFLLGHLLGDYVFQSDAMATNKIRWDITGWMYCLIHSLVYSMVVFALLQGYSIIHLNAFLTNPSLLILLIFITHFPIDKSSLAKYWLKLIGRKLPYEYSAISTPVLTQFTLYWFVYIVVDNSMHFLLMLIGLEIFFPGVIK